MATSLAPTPTVKGVGNLAKMFDQGKPSAGAPPPIVKPKPLHPAKSNTEQKKSIGKLNIPKDLQKTLNTTNTSQPSVSKKPLKHSDDGNREILKKQMPKTKPMTPNKPPNIANELSQIKLKPAKFPRPKENGMSEKNDSSKLIEDEYISEVIYGPNNESYRQVRFKAPPTFKRAPVKPTAPRQVDLQDILRKFTYLRF